MIDLLPDIYEVSSVPRLPNQTKLTTTGIKDFGMSAIGLSGGRVSYLHDQFRSIAVSPRTTMRHL